MYGFYPVEQRWRVDVVAVVVLLCAALIMVSRPRYRAAIAAGMAVALPPLVLFFFYGGIGLATVETREWGGLMLTLFIAVYAGLLAVPFGIVLALGRQSRLPAIRPGSGLPMILTGRATGRRPRRRGLRRSFSGARRCRRCNARWRSSRRPSAL